MPPPTGFLYVLRIKIVRFAVGLPLGEQGELVGVAVGMLLLPGPGGGDHFVQGRMRGALAEAPRRNPFTAEESVDAA